jgi:hypothetical protein
MFDGILGVPVPILSDVVGNKINKLHKQKYFRGIRTHPLGPLTGGVSVCEGGGVWLEPNKKTRGWGV